jgi:hypothetical protein
MTGSRTRVPTPPEPVPTWVREFGGTTPEAEPRELLNAGLRALRAALALPASDRQSAHALLAADALFSWAVEDAAASSEPEAALASILEAIVSLETDQDRVG